MYYILFRSRGCSLSEILTHFSNNVSLNDKTVERFIQNLLKIVTVSRVINRIEYNRVFYYRI